MFSEMMQSSGWMVGIMMSLMILLVFLGIALTIFWIVMLVDCVQRKKLSDGERIAWILIIIFTGALGAGLYYLVVKRNK